jgi:hypothetical protein
MATVCDMKVNGIEAMLYEIRRNTVNDHSHILVDTIDVTSNSSRPSLFEELVTK